MSNNSQIDSVSRELAVDMYFTTPSFEPLTDETPIEPEKPKLKDPISIASYCLMICFLVVLPFLLATILFSASNLFASIFAWLLILVGIFFTLIVVVLYAGQKQAPKENKKKQEAYQSIFAEWKNRYAELERRRSDYELECKDFIRQIPSDSRMNQWVNEDVNRIQSEAIRELDIEHDEIENKRIRPLVGNARNEARALDLPIKFKRGQDGILRGSYYKIVIICLTDYNVASYECLVNMRTGIPVSTNTKEFPYAEITNLETREAYINHDIKEYEGFRVKKTFSIATSGSNSIEVDYSFITDGSRSDSSTNASKNELEATDTIRAIRHMLREYKRKFEE